MIRNGSEIGGPSRIPRKVGEQIRHYESGLWVIDSECIENWFYCLNTVVEPCRCRCMHMNIMISKTGESNA